MATPGEETVPRVALGSLPAEVEKTIDLIRTGGPFPHAEDGAVFRNREGRLPSQPAGVYREYTVPTPGFAHRGPRRIVMGRTVDFFYTGDHYESFVEVTDL